MVLSKVLVRVFFTGKVTEQSTPSSSLHWVINVNLTGHSSAPHATFSVVHLTSTTLATPSPVTSGFA